ncbi:hypothetical protein [Ideonella livida]|uniref:Uncharacterized protein n=1 Tax=Ideonella livida TaxID=2707176 RepID=A0A7C9PIZ6_9BURK|nr:hypothetical protein [Ideonella livida]NDY92988.1 hypothetical protein [Ideonella livida]
MRHELSVLFDARKRLDIAVEAPLPDPFEARRWLDQEFVRLDCSPLRASGKVLTADKVLALASEVGESGFEDEHWRQAFAQNACAALARPLVVVDVGAMTVTC